MKKILKGVALVTVLLLVALSFAPTKVTAGLLRDASANDDIRLEPPEHGFTDIGTFINNLARIIFILAIVLVFFYFLYGGVKWITSGGDKAQTEAARNVLTAALLGFAVIALAYAIVKLLGSFFGIDIFGGFTIPTPPPTEEVSCVVVEGATSEAECLAACSEEGQFCDEQHGTWFCCTPPEED